MSRKDVYLKIGYYCSISLNVKFILSSEHPMNHISTYPFKTFILNDGKNYDAFGKGDIVLEDDVWIGESAIILSNVHIGQGAVIATGSVVTKDVPPYAVVAGVPAKIIKYRFSDNIIKKLLNINFANLDFADINRNIDEWYSEVTDDNIDKLISSIQS